MASEVTMEGKAERDDQTRSFVARPEVMSTTSAHMSEPSHMGSTRLQEPLEYVLVMCAYEEDLRW